MSRLRDFWFGSAEPRYNYVKQISGVIKAYTDRGMDMIFVSISPGALQFQIKPLRVNPLPALQPFSRQLGLIGQQRLPYITLSCSREYD